MGKMTENQIKGRRTWIVEKNSQRIMIATPMPHPKHGFWLHQRGYHNGDIRCTLCDKWINPNNPEEAKEIEVTPKGKRRHHISYCTDSSSYRNGACFSVVPHGRTNWRRESHARY